MESSNNLQTIPLFDATVTLDSNANATSVSIQPVIGNTISSVEYHHPESSHIRLNLDSTSSLANVAFSPMTTSKQKNKSTSVPAAADAIELLVNAAELREMAARESSVANGTSPAKVEGKGVREEMAMYGGPFTSKELGQLLLLCNPSSGISTAANKGCVSTRDSGVWSSLEECLISTLSPMLRAHVKSAVGVDLVSEGRNVILRSEEKNENEKAQPTTILQVNTSRSPFA